MTTELLEPRQLKTVFAVVNTADSGNGSFRWAIQQANSNTGPDTIRFDLRQNSSTVFMDVDFQLTGGDAAADVFVIRPRTALPALTDTTGGTTIAGRTQTVSGGDTNPFGPEIVIDGSQITTGAVNGLEISSNAHGNRIDSINIQNFPGQGISIIRSNDNFVSGLYIGTDATGNFARANGTTTLASAGGVMISAGAKRNIIGSNGDGINDAQERNLISGNQRHGVRIQQGALTDVTRDNIVRGNYIGINSQGRVISGLGNRTYAFELMSGNADGVTGNIIRDNFVAGNQLGVVHFSGVSSSANTLIANGPRFAAATVANRVLFVTGTELADNIAIYQIGQNVIVRDVATSSVLQVVAASQLLSIRVDVFGGRDSVNGSGAGFGQPASFPLVVFGGAGPDLITGGRADDHLFGDAGNDTIRGGAGRDSLRGGDEKDQLEGGEGDDELYGERGIDHLFGENGNDSLYGGDDVDFLYGGSGLDGLFGGRGNDILSGGPDADRFLLTNNNWTYTSWGDVDSYDAAVDNAVIRFITGTFDWMPDLNGVPVARPGRIWQGDEIERVDVALRAIHVACGNTFLLMTSTGAEMRIARHSGFARGSNDGINTIHLTDAQFNFPTANDNFLRGYVMHEIGHFWNGDQLQNSNWVDFLGLSGWIRSPVHPGSLYTASAFRGDDWWYRSDAGFVSVYSRDNPLEDFAESFSAYFAARAGWPFYTGEAGAPGSLLKMQLIGRWVRSLPLYLRY